jgi:hypothetical protein
MKRMWPLLFLMQRVIVPSSPAWAVPAKKIVRREIAVTRKSAVRRGADEWAVIESKSPWSAGSKKPGRNRGRLQSQQATPPYGCAARFPAGRIGKQEKYLSRLRE